MMFLMSFFDVVLILGLGYLHCNSDVAMKVATNGFLVSFIEEPRHKGAAVEDSRGRIEP